MTGPDEMRVVTVGRQPVVDYLTKDYEGFKQAMLGQIPLLLPEWTDRDENDFGVVLIELFAYVADILSYYQDRVANEAYLSTATQRRSVTELLRLIGYQIDPGLAASAYLHLETTADLTVTADRLPYPVRTAGRPGEADATFEATREFTVRTRNNGVDLAASGGLAAGASAVQVDRGAHALAEGDRVYVETTTTLPTGGRRVRRSPLLTVTGVRAATADRDEISWLPPLPEPFPAAGSVLRGNNVPVTHGSTVTDEPIVFGDGTPGQRFALSRGPVTHLLTGDGGARRRSAPELEVRVDGIRWEEVETFVRSGPADLVYTTGTDENDVLSVAFGTGARGSVPPAGARITTTYRIGLGTAGNVGPDALTVLPTVLPGLTAATNPFAAQGGADRESTEEAKISGPGSVVAQERAVTLEDYELLAEGFPGVGKAKARVGLRGGYKVVQVFVAPEAPTVFPPPPPADQLRLALGRHLEQRMPVNRMAGVDVLAPRYVPVDVVLDVHVRAEANRARVAAEVEAVLADLFSFARQDFGRPVRVGELFSALYPVPGVDFIRLRRLERAGRPAPDECGFADVPIAEDELAFLGRLTVNAFGGLR